MFLPFCFFPRSSSSFILILKLETVEKEEEEYRDPIISIRLTLGTMLDRTLRQCSQLPFRARKSNLQSPEDYFHPILLILLNRRIRQKSKYFIYVIQKVSMYKCTFILELQYQQEQHQVHHNCEQCMQCVVCSVQGVGNLLQNAE